VTKALALGFQSREDSLPGEPFFGLISTPSESCMAGFIALGAELRGLSLNGPGSRSIDSARYFRFLWGLKNGTVLRWSKHPHRKYVLAPDSRRNSERTLIARRLNVGYGQRIWIKQPTCLEWRPEGEVPRDAGGYDALTVPPEATALRSLLLPGQAISDGRLRLNSDEVVLVGPAGGVPAFRHVYEEHCSIGSGASLVPLSELLGLRGWAGTENTHAWRGVLINALSPKAVTDAKKAARHAVLAVFDGAWPFLKLGDYFRRSDRVVVVNRILSNSMLERLCGKLYQDQHDGHTIVERGSTWLPDLPPAIQAFRARPRRREATL
jgi:hypothetical protein